MRDAYASAGSLVPQPSGEQCEPRAEINQPGRHPHDEPAELLIFERRQPPGDRQIAARRVPDACRHREQRAEKAGVNGSRENIQNSDAIGIASARVEQRPPKQQRREEESGVLRGVNPVVVERCVEQGREMPDPKGRGMKSTRRKVDR
jgi:hypothetical protein